MPFVNDVHRNDDVSVITDDFGIWRPLDLDDEEVPSGVSRTVFNDDRRQSIVRTFDSNGWVRPTYNTR